MLALKYLLMCGGFGMILVAVGILGFDLYEEALYRRALATPGVALPHVTKWRWRTSLALVLLAWGPILLAFSIVVVPTGMAGVRVSETSGTVSRKISETRVGHPGGWWLRRCPNSTGDKTVVCAKRFIIRPSQRSV